MGGSKTQLCCLNSHVFTLQLILGISPQFSGSLIIKGRKVKTLNKHAFLFVSEVVSMMNYLSIKRDLQ